MKKTQSLWQAFRSSSNDIIFILRVGVVATAFIVVATYCLVQWYTEPPNVYSRLSLPAYMQPAAKNTIDGCTPGIHPCSVDWHYRYDLHNEHTVNQALDDLKQALQQAGYASRMQTRNGLPVLTTSLGAKTTLIAQANDPQSTATANGEQLFVTISELQ